MNEVISQILLQARGSWRFRWHALTLAWILAVGGWVIVMLLPSIYEAHTRVYVDTDSVLKPLLNGLTVNTDVAGRASMIARMILGRPNLERVAHETDLAQRAHTPEQLTQVVTLLSQRISIDAGSGNLYTLRYTDTDPAVAQRVVQHLLNAFVEDTLGIKRADNGSAQKFLQDQIHDYEERLRAAENRLADFKRTNVGLMPGQQGDYYTRLQTESGKLEDLQQKFRLASERRNEISKQLGGEEPTFGLFSPSSPDTAGASPVDGKLAEYRRQLDELLLQYTEKHPKVIALKETIVQLEAQQAAAQKSPKPRTQALPKDRADAAMMALDINPVYQDLRIELSRAEVDLAELHQQIAEEQHIVADLKSRVNTIPMVEAQLTQLNRDYEVTRTQYQALLQRLDSARLSDQAEASNEQVRFRIIEPPVRPTEPIAPRRVPLITIVLLAALGAGAALAVVLNQLKPVFISRAMLAEVTGLPVLGSVSFEPHQAQNRFLQRDPALAGLLCAALLIAYVIGLGWADSFSRLLRAWIR